MDYLINWASTRNILVVFYSVWNWLLSKHETLTQCWFNVGPSSTTLAQHWTSIESISCVFWVETLYWHSRHRVKNELINLCCTCLLRPTSWWFTCSVKSSHGAVRTIICFVLCVGLLDTICFLYMLFKEVEEKTIKDADFVTLSCQILLSLLSLVQLPYIINSQILVVDRLFCRKTDLM